jgi:TPR repeat protein
MPKEGDGEALYVCTIKAALAGYAPAEARLGELYAFTRDTSPGWNLGPIRQEPAHLDAEAALYWFRKAADAGDPRGAFLAGQLYAVGEGAPQDDTQAAAFYTRAVAGGYGPAADALQKLKTRDRRIADFDTRYAAKAAAGDVAAMQAYADAYLAGDPLRYDPAKGAQWAHKAADAGSAAAQSMMGELSVRGLGMPQDLDAAVGWLIKAAAGSYHERDYYLVSLHGEPALSATSRAAIEAASTRGILHQPRAGLKLNIRADGDPEVGGQMTVDMSDRPLDELTRLANGGDTDAQVNLALRYLDGNGVPADPAAARHWFEQAAFQNTDADMNLGDMAYTAVPPDVRAAADYYATAAVMGDALGAANAVKLYRQLAEPVKAYAAALSVRRLPAMPPSADVKALDAVLSFEDRAKGLLYLNEQQLAHYRSSR